MNTFNISFLWMEISILGSFFFPFLFARHLAELGSFLVSKAIKEFQLGADAQGRTKEMERLAI